MAIVDGLGAAVDNGKVVGAGNSKDDKKPAQAGNNMDKDAFLKLLVAQMKYQDPLEPTSNTEFVSQYATFAELEHMQNMSATLEMSRASSYVGQVVSIKTVTESGKIKEVEGIVEFVVFENNEAKLSIDGELYSVDDVYAAVSSEYKMAFDMAVTFNETLNGLPDVEHINLQDALKIVNLRDAFNGMSSYQQGFISNTQLTKLTEKYVPAATKLIEAADQQEEAFTKAIEAMPDVDDITLEDEEAINNLQKFFEDMPALAIYFDKELISKLNAYVKKLEELKDASGNEEAGDSGTEDTTGDTETV